MTITFSGLASKLDTAALIDGLMAAERVPLERLTNKMAQIDSAKTTMSSFLSKLTALKTAAETLADPVKFSSYAVSSSDETSIVASVTGAASAGAFAFSVTQLAQEERTYSDEQADGTGALGLTGTLSLQVASNAQVDITIDPTDSLTTIATKISASGERVSAAVVYTGTGYTLQIRGLDTGAANAIGITETGFDLGLSDPLNEKQHAQDAVFSVDNIQMSRPTNQVSGVIPGVTLALKHTTASPVDITTASDPDALADKIQTFVDAYNAVVGAGHSAAGFGTLQAANPQLAGDYAIRTALSRISRALGDPIAGTSGKYTTLSSVGLKSKMDGSIELDRTALEAAIGDDPAGVARLFVVDSTIGATGAMTPFADAIDAMITDSTSLVKQRIDSLSTLYKRLDDDASKLELRLAAFEDTLRARFTQLELLISDINAQGDAVDSIAQADASEA
jgi:flagellar hook-associated protein 2